MHPDESIRVDGTVTQVLSNAMSRVALSNGHVLNGHLSKPLRLAGQTLQPGQIVHLELTPCDLSRGRILGLATLPESTLPGS
jgi:translation initiation factor IF-1